MAHNVERHASDLSENLKNKIMLKAISLISDLNKNELIEFRGILDSLIIYAAALEEQSQVTPQSVFFSFLSSGAEHV